MVLLCMAETVLEYNWGLTVNCKGCDVAEESGNTFPLTAFIGILVFSFLKLCFGTSATEFCSL